MRVADSDTQIVEVALARKWRLPRGAMALWQEKQMADGVAPCGEVHAVGRRLDAREDQITGQEDHRWGAPEARFRRSTRPLGLPLVTVCKGRRRAGLPR